jgi:hypothetical protein
MIAVVDQADTAVWLFHKQEWTDGELRAPQSLQIKYRRAGDTYLKYVGDVNNGREVLYRPRENPDVILVNPSPLLPTMTFDKDGRMATSGERYSVDNLALHGAVGRYRQDTDTLSTHGDQGMVVTDRGKRLVAGEAAHCWLVELPKDRLPALYARRVETCVADRTRTLISMKAWDYEDGQMRVIEDYVWAELQLGVALTDIDFDPDNPEYGF